MAWPAALASTVHLSRLLTGQKTMPARWYQLRQGGEQTLVLMRRTQPLPLPLRMGALLLWGKKAKQAMSTD